MGPNIFLHYPTDKRLESDEKDISKVIALQCNKHVREYIEKKLGKCVTL